jgi:hypothetical protein
MTYFPIVNRGRAKYHPEAARADRPDRTCLWGCLLRMGLLVDAPPE